MAHINLYAEKSHLRVAKILAIGKKGAAI